MGDFKPLLTLNGFAMIQMTAQSVLDGGVSRVYVVTGRNSECVRDSLQGVEDALGFPQGAGEGQSIEFVHNSEFATTDMLHSVKLGLQALLESEAAGMQPVDAVFILPGDIAAVAPQTFGLLRAKALHTDAWVLHPIFKGQKGHPLLIRRSCFDTILSFEREGGLKEALRPFKVELVENADKGTTLDADESVGFEVLAAYVRRTKGLSYTVVEELLNTFKTPQHIRDHCRAVGELAARMAKRLNIFGMCLDSELSRSAAALHDMNRLDKHHSQAAAENLRRYGYDAVARVVGDHHDAQGFAHEVFTESLIVFVADKLVKETEIVGLERRYAPALERFAETSSVGRRIREEMAMCREAIARYEKLTEDCLYPID
jgi:CTP:molybdopterin cytidylyltransferase MocA